MVKKSTKERIIEVVENTPGATSTDIEKATGITYGTSYTNLRSLVKAGKLKRKAGGRPWSFHYYTPDQFDNLGKLIEDKNQQNLDSYGAILS